jgi:hypothetical protein
VRASPLGRVTTHAANSPRRRVTSVTWRHRSAAGCTRAPASRYRCPGARPGGESFSHAASDSPRSHSRIRTGYGEPAVSGTSAGERGQDPWCSVAASGPRSGIPTTAAWAVSTLCAADQGPAAASANPLRRS